MVEPKRIPPSGIAQALEKANRYRLLNEPLQAESICLDILQIDPAHQPALTTLLLALTDQFSEKFTEVFQRAKELLPQLEGEYDQHYYEGIVNERWAEAQLDRGMPADFASSWIREAMRCFEKAIELAAEDNPDPILRWNTCVRMQQNQSTHTDAEPAMDEIRDVHSEFGDDVPMR